MKKISTLNQAIIPFGVLLLSLGFNSCISGDDLDRSTGTKFPTFEPTGSIMIEDEQWVYQNTLNVNVSAGQLSWLTAVLAEDEETNNFIAQPVKIEEGQYTSVKLIFDENSIPEDDIGKEVVLKLYADNPSAGEQGAWDPEDFPIENAIKTLRIKAYPTDTTDYFLTFDTNSDDSLDFLEALESYNFSNYFSEIWDTNQDGSLNLEEFYNSFFNNTDFSLDNAVSQEEWNSGYAALYSKWADDDFSTFDKNQNNLLNKSEWMEIFRESGWFEAYDTNDDELVSQTEWHKGLFADWDTNANGIIEREEFENYYSYVLAWMRW